MLLRISIISFLLCILSLFLFSFTRSTQLAENVWKELGITETQGTEKIRNSFLYGHLEYYGLKNLHAIALSNRAALTTDLLVYAKNYVNGSSFRKTWMEERKAARPVTPVMENKTEEEIRREKIEEMETSIQKGEETIKKMPDLEKAMRPTIDLMKKNIDEYKKPDNAFIKSLVQYQQMENERRKQRYEEDLQRWNRNYPENFDIRLKEYLEKYLSLAATVDFKARLEEKYGKKRFVDPALEARPGDWKMIFRAGPEVYGAAQPFVQQWLKELK